MWHIKEISNDISDDITNNKITITNIVEKDIASDISMEYPIIGTQCQIFYTGGFEPPNFYAISYNWISQ